MAVAMSYDVVSQFVRETCCDCGVEFCMTTSFHSACKDNTNRYFHCPNGHRQHYTRGTETELREKLETEQRNRERYEKLYNQKRKEATLANTQLKSTRTRMRNLKTRIANGVCPCCKRQFCNLQRHMTTKHPAYKPSKEQPHAH